MDNKNMPKDTKVKKDKNEENEIDELLDEEIQEDESEQAINEELDPDIARALNPKKVTEKSSVDVDYIPDTDLQGFDETEEEEVYEEVESIY